MLGHDCRSSIEGTGLSISDTPCPHPQVGTPPYCAPEGTNDSNNQSHDYTFDVYSAGAVLYDVLLHTDEETLEESLERKLSVKTMCSMALEVHEGANEAHVRDLLNLARAATNTSPEKRLKGLRSQHTGLPGEAMRQFSEAVRNAVGGRIICTYPEGWCR